MMRFFKQRKTSPGTDESFFSASKVWLRYGHLLWQPTRYCYAAMAALVLLGQYFILREEFKAGLGLTTLGLGFLLLARAGAWRISVWIGAARGGLEHIADSWHRLRHRLPDVGHEAMAEQEARPVGQPREFLHSRRFSEVVRRHAVISVTLPRNLLIAVGAVLILASQPFLFLEKFYLALAIMLPGILAMIYALTSTETKFEMGNVNLVARNTLLAMAGIALIVFGNAMIWKFGHEHLWLEIAGVAGNTLGVFILLFLLPGFFEDPETGTGVSLEAFSGEARRPLAWLGKSGLVLLGLVLFWLARNSNGDNSSMKSLQLAIAGVALIALSFPWQHRFSGIGHQPKSLYTFSVNFFRLLALGIGVYLAYRGQVLISHGQLSPSLCHFAGAGLALLVAFREPREGKTDPLLEPGLKWYWEALFLIAILAFGIWIRTYLIADMPLGLEGDEAGTARNAQDIAEGKFNSISAHWSSQPLFWLFGKNLAHNLFGLGNFGIKFLPMVYGVLGILATHIFGRMLYGPRVGLAIAYLFAAARWHIHFSRFGWGNTLLVLILLLAFYFLIQALRTRRKWHFVLAGMCFALSVQTETAGRLVPFMCFICLGYLALAQRRFFIRNWKPLLAILLGVWLTGASYFLILAKKPHLLFNRVQEVSILSEDPNAPRDIGSGIARSLTASLTMLNWQGDTRTRHNGGMTGEPMLDFWTAILFALGFVYILYYWRRMRYCFILIWFFAFMCSSIFSIEAPQAHRAFGLFPAIFLIIGAFLDRTRRLLQQNFGRLGIWAGTVVFIALLIPATQINYHKYFDTYPVFDAGFTSMSKFVGQRINGWEHFVLSPSWSGHPPFQLYARKASSAFHFNAFDVVPMRVAIDKGTDVSYNMVYHFKEYLPTLQSFYPLGEHVQDIHPKHGHLFEAWSVKHEQIMKTRGLTARYWSNWNWQGQPELTRQELTSNVTFNQETWPLSGPGSVEWQGTFWIPHQGKYTFYLRAADGAEVRLGRHRLQPAGPGQETRTTLQLVGGLHCLRIRTRHRTPNGKFQLAWSCPEGITHYVIYKSPYSRSFLKEPIPQHHLFTYPEPMGLLASYYVTPDWKGKPFIRRVEPTVYMPGQPYGLLPPLSLLWSGKLIAPVDGKYQFFFKQPGYGEIVIGDQVVIRQKTPPEGWSASGTPQNPIWLSAGRHSIEVRSSMRYNTWFKMSWQLPGEETQEVVPAKFLVPEEE